MTQFVKPLVLVVEDEALVRMVAAEALLDVGFTVLEAEHAAEALAIHAAGAAIDLLFTDVNMPGPLNGIDLAERLRALEPQMHILITSALPILRPVDHIGGVFLPKPYTGRALGTAASALRAA